ncbi:MAG: LCP family protein [Oscillospiraceae bacterium]|jgi:LCP family protein required for cell wall assembly|nr:LCP family protein [Oscillospiraceae bacterium]
MKTRQQKRLRTIILVAILAIALGVTAVFGYFYIRLHNDIDRSSGYIYAEETEPEEEEDKGIGVEVGYDDVDATSLDEFLTSWATNDIQKLQDKNVLNILLCGVDSQNGKATGGRSDAILLVSVNKKTKTVTLASFFRDSYTYIDLMGNTKNPRTIMDKVNAAYSLGGPATLIDTIEANYKIIIDGYISVDFNSFPKLINALGGVTLDVTKTEANFINSTAPTMHHNFPAGENVTLNGAQALVYSRIRHLASGDIDRTARQRKVIMAILASARKASNGQILNAANQILDGKYLTTNLTDLQITTLLSQAFSGGWMDYEIKQCYTPTVETENATGIPTQNIKGNTWFWVVDYPRAAEELQLQLYGTTSIALTVEGEDRSDYLARLFKEASGSRGSSSGSGSGTSSTQPQGNDATADATEPNSQTGDETDVTQESTTQTPANENPTWPWWIPTKAPESTAPTEPPTEEPPTVPPTAPTETATEAPPVDG